MRSAIHWAMTTLIFVPEVGKLGGGMWLWGANQLVLWVFYYERKKESVTIYLTRNHFRDTTQSILALNLTFHRIHVEIANNIFHLHNIER